MLTSVHSHPVCLASEFERMDPARHLEKAYGAKVPKNLQQKCEYVARDGGGNYRTQRIQRTVIVCICIDLSWKIDFGY